MIYGLVGKSGSGKSTAANVFAENGFFVIDCDKVAAQMLVSDENVKARLADAFGADILKCGAVDKKLLAKRAFKDRASLDTLNSLTHPPIIAKIKELAAEKEKVLLDAPTLFESGADKLCDKIIAVITPDDICEKRLIAREGITAEVAKRRLSMQKEEKYLRERSDIIIEGCEILDDFVRRIKDVAKTL